MILAHGTGLGKDQGFVGVREAEAGMQGIPGGIFAGEENNQVLAGLYAGILWEGPFEGIFRVVAQIAAPKGYGLAAAVIELYPRGPFAGFIPKAVLVMQQDLVNAHRRVRLHGSKLQGREYPGLAVGLAGGGLGGILAAGQDAYPLRDLVHGPGEDGDLIACAVAEHQGVVGGAQAKACVDAVFAFVPGEPYGHVSAGLQGGAGQPPLEGLVDVVGKIVVGKQQGRIPAVVQLGPGIGLSIRVQASPGLGHTFGDGQGVGGTGGNGVRSGGKDHFPVFLAGGRVRAIAILAGSIPGIGDIRQQGGQIHLLQNGVIGVGEQKGFAVF